MIISVYFCKILLKVYMVISIFFYVIFYIYSKY